MSAEDLINNREWDVLLPPQCRSCIEANAELNTGQSLITIMIGAKAANQACARMIDYVENTCLGLADPDDTRTCPSFPSLLLTNFIDLPPPPIDIADR